MKEKNKMLIGELYDPNDKELIKERKKCKALCYKYNNLKPSRKEKREKIMKELLGATKEKFYIEQPFQCDYGYNIEIGEMFYANHNLIILDTNKVKFGDNVLIGPNCAFYCAEHPLEVEIRITGQEFGEAIVVGDNVWIGGNVVVLPGVHIGNNVVIGAGSIVTKDIPDNSLAYGNPCRVVKKI